MIGVIKKASEIAEFFQDGWYYICVIMLIFNDSQSLETNLGIFLDSINVTFYAAFLAWYTIGCNYVIYGEII